MSKFIKTGDKSSTKVQNELLPEVYKLFLSQKDLYKDLFYTISLPEDNWNKDVLYLYEATLKGTLDNYYPNFKQKILSATARALHPDHVTTLCEGSLLNALTHLYHVTCEAYPEADHKAVEREINNIASKKISQNFLDDQKEIVEYNKQLNIQVQYLHESALQGTLDTYYPKFKQHILNITHNRVYPEFAKQFCHAQKYSEAKKLAEESNKVWQNLYESIILDTFKKEKEQIGNKIVNLTSGKVSEDFVNDLCTKKQRDAEEITYKFNEIPQNLYNTDYTAIKQEMHELTNGKVSAGFVENFFNKNIQIRQKIDNLPPLQEYDFIENEYIEKNEGRKEMGSINVEYPNSGQEDLD
ncbi:hypothetical protein OAP56_00435 [Rickettsiaceae bacterium]|nr:hypothetical protein [Rickettsiaceae bacterium]